MVASPDLGGTMSYSCFFFYIYLWI